MLKMKILTTVFCLLLLSACTNYRYFDVNVDSISSNSATQKKTYILLPGNKDGKVSDLQFQEFAGLTENALQAQGFRKANKIDDAEIAILLCYGISDPQFYNYTYSVPVWGQTGVSSSTTSGSVYSYSNATTYSGKTTYTPSYGVVGSSTHIGTGVLYARYMVLSGFDLEQFKRTKKIENAQELWSTRANSVGASGDLREIFPALLIASQKHIAENTGKQISYSLREDDEYAEKVNTLRH